MERAKEIKYSSNLTVADTRRYGLCSTCNSFDICTQRKTWIEPVIFCEEFDDYVPPNPIENNPAAEQTHLAVATGDSEHYRGLCMNCEHRSTCVYAKAEGGVWHCEEYE